MKFTKVFNATIKGVDAEKRTMTAVVSTQKTDRDGDIIVPDAFKKDLKHYREHPVLLSMHRSDDLRRQIGKAVKVGITDDGLEATFEYFAGEGNPEADWGWLLSQKGIAAFSIGFMGLEYDWIKQKDSNGTEYISGRKFTRVELLEISQVTVPANRQALQNAYELADAECKMAAVVMKGMDAGDIPPADETKTKAKQQEESGQDDQTGDYTELLFGADGKPKADPVSAPVDTSKVYDSVIASVKAAMQ